MPKEAMMPEQGYHGLLLIAKGACAHAYVPYSGNAGGAALLARDGRVFTGCTIEVANYTSSICAGKAALIKAVTEGVREFDAIAVAGAGVGPSGLCGDCLQSLAEFGPDIVVVSEEHSGEPRPLRQLLPRVV